MKVRYYLDSKEHEDGFKAVILRIRHAQKRIEVYLKDLQIHPTFWDLDKQRVKQVKGFTAARHINAILNRIDSKITSCYFEAIEQQLSTKELKEKVRAIAIAELTGKQQKENKALDMLELFDKYVELNPYNSKAITLKKFVSLRNNLKAIMDKYGVYVTFEGIDEKFMSKFNQFFFDQDYLNDSINKFYANLKRVMKWAYVNKYHTNDYFRKLSYPKDAKNDTIFLYKSEIEELRNADLSDTGPFYAKVMDQSNKWNGQMRLANMRNVRDIFLFQCYTGQRYSDIRNLKWGDVVKTDHGTEWHLYQVKGNKSQKVVIPIASLALDIYQRQERKTQFLFDTPASQNFNDGLKDLFKLLNLDRTIRQVRYSGKKRIEKEYKLYECISSHKARATLVTLLKSNKVPDNTIMSITGHTDIRSMKRYEGVAEDIKRNAIDDAFGE